ncbi:MAG: CDP-diacylglycerol--glycerol-3-phosphate 3-phosphatidyltransferase [Thermoleophilia bacterium]
MGLNLPNWITVFRILLIPVFMTVLLGALPGGATWAAVVFTLAAATDSLDGYFARRRKESTVLGAFLDPLADKLLVTAALLALIELDRLSAGIAMVIIAREFAVSGLRMVAAAENVIIPASKWGKIKTASQMVAIVALIVELPGRFGGVTVTAWLLALAVVLTVLSGADYFLKARVTLRPPLDVGEEEGETS